MSVRLFPFDSNSETQQRKRLKLSTYTDDDQSNAQSDTSPAASSEIATLLVGEATLPIEIATLPLELGSSQRRPAYARPLSISQVFSSPPPVPCSPTQPTQPLDLEIPGTPTVQVPASSPAQNRDSPIRPRKDPVGTDGTVKPFSFYSSRNLQASQNRGIIDLDSDDGLQYIGSSSDEESEFDLVPDFKTLAAKAKVPSMKEIKARREDKNTIEKVEESTINFSRYLYKPANTFPTRLDTLGGKGINASSRPHIQQSRPERAQPLIDLHLDDIRDPNMKRKVLRIKNIMPKKSHKTIFTALQRTGGDFDDACDLLTEEEVNLLSDDSKKCSTSTAIPNKMLKRETRAPRKAIKEKWSSTQTRGQLPSLSPEVEVKPRRRLVKGSRIKRDPSPPAPIVIEDDASDASPGASDNVSEQKLESKVLEFVNTCELKDLIDIAATTEEIAQAVLSKRPFKNIDAVREVSIGSVLPKGGGRGRNRRPVGTRIVNSCSETFRGYAAIDTLIKKCEDLGNPLAATIKSWGVDITGASSKGELEIVNLNFGSTSDSGIGTPAEDEGIIIHGRKPGKFMPEQPKNLGPGVTLKDYQVIGVNWLNMLYERKLSCILADEMGALRRLLFFCHLRTDRLHHRFG